MLCVGGLILCVDMWGGGWGWVRVETVCGWICEWVEGSLGVCEVCKFGGRQDHWGGGGV